MNMVDNLTSPLSRVTSGVDGSVSRLQGMESAFGGMAKGGAVIAGVGAQITEAVLSPVAATFDTRRAIGELASLGVEDLDLLEDAARSFSDTWAGTTKAEFITAAYDIKSGIASLTDEGIARYTEVSGLTAKATKSTIGEMTDLFATGYGIYKGFYDDLTDIEFSEMFSAGIAESVRAFKTSGSGMASSIKSLGASATMANVPLEEQLAILGMLQATMSGPEAGTKYKAFLRTAVKGGEALGLTFTDTNNQLLSLPEILDQLQGKFGDTIDAAEKMEIQKAFGDTESIQFIDLLYNKTGELQDNILGLYGAMGEGMGIAENMATAINSMEPDKYQVLQQRIQNVKETIGNTLLPTVNELFGKGGELLERAAVWIDQNQELVRVIMLVALALGGILTVGGSVITVIGGVGLVFTKTAGLVGGFIGVIKNLPGMFDTVRLYGMYAGDGIKAAFGGLQKYGGVAVGAVKNVALSIGSMAKTAAVSAVTALKNMALGLVGMAKQAITTAATALPGLISGVWSFTAALLANPITWVVIGIVALVAGIILLWNKCEGFRNGVMAIWGAIKSGISAAGTAIKNVFGGIASFFGNVLGAAKNTVSEKLGNIKAAYEEHGGGIKGVAFAAIEGVKGFYTAGFSFIDNLTGGKLTAINDKFTEKFDSIRSTVSSKMEAVKQNVSAKLENMRAAYDQHGGGIRGAAAVAMTGVRSVFEGGYNILDNITGGRLSAIRDKFAQGIDDMKNAVEGKFTEFKESGRKLIETFTEGIKSVITAPVEAVKGGLAKLRELLPFSDAKTGPLSTLTLSGERTLSTYAHGIRQAEALPAEAMADSLSKVGALLQDEDTQDTDIRSTRPPVKTIERRELREERKETETSTSEKEKQIIIQKLEMTIDFSKLKELPHLLRFLREVEDYVNANGLATEGGS